MSHSGGGLLFAVVFWFVETPLLVVCFARRLCFVFLLSASPIAFFILFCFTYLFSFCSFAPSTVLCSASDLGSRLFKSPSASWWFPVLSVFVVCVKGLGLRFSRSPSVFLVVHFLLWVVFYVKLRLFFVGVVVLFIRSLATGGLLLMD